MVDLSKSEVIVLHPTAVEHVAVENFGDINVFVDFDALWLAIILLVAISPRFIAKLKKALQKIARKRR